jgi:hypothetical protein
MIDSMKPNLPTPEGRALGRELARLCDGEIGVGRDDRCSTCAFRSGTVPNGCAPTLMDALKCMMERVPFYCHEQEGKLCAGWREMLPGKGEPAVAVPWAFSDGGGRP